MKKGNKTLEQFRNGIFRAPSRTYGEKYIEPILRALFKWDETVGNENDAIDIYKMYKEIKSSKVLLKQENKKNMSLVDKIIYENYNDVVNRLINFEDCFDKEYLSNIQNIKRDHFDHLVYVMLFKDCVKVFISEKNDISSIPNWSGKHGRYDEYGKSGQFGITKNNIKWHLENNLVMTLTWDQVYEITKKI